MNSEFDNRIIGTQIVSNVDHYVLGDILDLQSIQLLMDTFYALTKSGNAILDIQGNVLTATGWQDICTKFHRQHPETCRNCKESDTILAAGIEPGQYRLYRCKNGLWDIATPIVVDGKHLGNLYLGQFLFDDETMDYEAFRSTARKCGFDEVEYMAALERAPRMSHETVKNAMEFCVQFANMISAMGHSKIKLEQKVAEQTQEMTLMNEELSSQVEEVDSLNQNLAELNAKLEQRVADRTDELASAYKRLMVKTENLERAQTALASSEGQLRTLVETIPDLIWLKNLDGVYLSCNTMFENFFGAKEAEIVGKTDYDFVNKELADFFRDHDRKAMEAGKPSVNEEWLTFANDGHRAFVETIKTPMRDAKGTLIGVLGIARDITDRFHNEEKIKRASEIQAVLREIAEAALASKTLEELYAKVHQAVARVLPADNFLINMLDEMTQEIVVSYCSKNVDFIPKRRPRAKGMTEYVMRLGKAALFSESDVDKLRETGEYTLERVHKVGVRQALGAPLTDSQGKAFGLISFVLLDDTQTFCAEDVEILSVIAAQVSIAIERKNAEEALSEASERHQLLVEQARDGIVLVSSEGRFMTSNDAFLNMMGYTQDELTQHFVQDIVIPDEKAEIPENMHKIASGAGMLKEWNLVRKDGTAFPTEVSARVLSDGRHVSIIRDITERRQREQELLEDARLATRVQKALLSMPAESKFLEIHAIFNPLGYVGGDLYFMDWRYEGRLLRGFLIDAPGHGLSTALHTASLHVLLREVNELDLPLTDAMRWLSKRAAEYFGDSVFIGALGFEIDLETRQMQWTCAGIRKIWVAAGKQQGAIECPITCRGIGQTDNFNKMNLPLEVGDAFYFMTDGMAALLEQLSALPLNDYSKMAGLIRTLAEKEDRPDDATAVCIRVSSLPQSTTRQDGWPKILRINSYGDYQRFKGEVAKILEEVTGKPHSLQEVAVNEALANAMECRDGVPRQHKARLRFNRVGKLLVVRVKTTRMGFAGNAILRRLRSHPEDVFSFGEDASMGRGIPIMLSTSYKMAYNSEGTEVLLAWKM